MSENRSAVCDIHGVINLDALSTFFTQLTQQINEQNQTIAKLQATVNTLVSITDFEDRMARVNQGLKTLEIHVGQVKEAATSRLKDANYTSGELAASNFYQIQKLQQQISRCISRDEVEKQYQELMTIEETNRKIQKNLTVLSQITDEVNQSQTNLLLQFQHQETILQRKLDRSELHQLQSLVAKVLSYDEFRDRTETMMTRYQGFEASTRNTLEVHTADLKAVHARIDLLTVEVNKAATRRDLHILAKEMKAMSERLELCATNRDLEEAKSRILKLLQLLEALQKDMGAATVRMNEQQAAIHLRATIVDMQTHVKTKDFDATLQRIQRELQARPLLPTTDDHLRRIQSLEGLQQADSRRISVAMKFVEWFSNRGENYDHNLRILDRHLKDLVTSEQTPRVHSYFLPGNRVQFTSAEPLTTNMFDGNVAADDMTGGI